MTRSRLAASGAAALLALALTACGGSSGSSASSGSAAPTTAASSAAASSAAASPSAAGAVCESASGPGDVAANAKDFKFDPSTINVNAGQSVTWTNGDGAPHSIILDDGACKTDTFAGGATTTLKFNVAGSYKFHCGVHPSMTGTIEVKG